MSVVKGEVIDAHKVPALTTVDSLMADAVQKGGAEAVDVLERLMVLKEREDAKVAQRAFVEAMGCFQAECPVIYRRKQVTGGTNHQYAPIEDIYHITKPLEQKYGFTHSFDTELRDDGVLIVTCKVTHADGHNVSTAFPVPATQGVITNSGKKLTNGAQDMGIMLTYGKRYAYMAAFALTIAGDDLDARLPQETLPPISPERANALRERFQAAGGKQEAAFLSAQFGVDTFEELTEEEANKAAKYIAQKEAAQQ